MSKLASIRKIREIYEQGGNILKYLSSSDFALNDEESIAISYDFQAGTYTDFSSINVEYLNKYTDALIEVFDELDNFKSIVEVGVGEATLMNPLMSKIDPDDKLYKFGFDISWSRLRYARQNSERMSNSIKLFVANLFQIPLPDNSIDVVYTSHSLEPNGGKEKEALKELYRVAKKYVILLEPDYENASSEGKIRMDEHKYVKNIGKNAIELGYKLVASRPFPVSSNTLNPTGLTILEKQSQQSNPIQYLCPVTKAELKKYNDVYTSDKAGLMYPIINKIPCLCESHAILGIQYYKFNN